MKTHQFKLSRKGIDVGLVVWSYETDKRGRPVSGSGRLSGDKDAVSVLDKTVRQAVTQEWRNVAPPPCGGVVSDPLAFMPEMLSVLIQAEFDIPPVLLPFWKALRGMDDPPEGLVY